MSQIQLDGNAIGTNSESLRQDAGLLASFSIATESFHEHLQWAQTLAAGAPANVSVPSAVQHENVAAQTTSTEQSRAQQKQTSSEPHDASPRPQDAANRAPSTPPQSAAGVTQEGKKESAASDDHAAKTDAAKNSDQPRDKAAAAKDGAPQKKEEKKVDGDPANPQAAAAQAGEAAARQPRGCKAEDAAQSAAETAGQPTADGKPKAVGKSTGKEASGAAADVKDAAAMEAAARQGADAIEAQQPGKIVSAKQLPASATADGSNAVASAASAAAAKSNPSSAPLLPGEKTAVSGHTLETVIGAAAANPAAQSAETTDPEQQPQASQGSQSSARRGQKKGAALPNSVQAEGDEAGAKTAAAMVATTTKAALATATVEQVVAVAPQLVKSENDSPKPFSADSAHNEPVLPGGAPPSSSASPAPRGDAAAGSEFGAADRVRFVQRVASAFQAVGQGGGTVRLRLSPPELGSLRLEVSVRNGAMTARVQADNQTTRNLLLDNLPALRERLAQQNIKIEQFHVDLTDHSTGGLPQQTSQQSQPQQQGGGYQPPRAVLDRRGSGPAAVVSGPARRPGETNQLDVLI